MTATSGSVDRSPGRLPLRIGSLLTSGLAAPIASGCCLLTGAVYIAIDDPTDGSLVPPCPFRTLTGWWCPGCGLTRATHHLLRGDLASALRFHLFVVVVLAAMIVGWFVWTLDRSGHRPALVGTPPAWVPSLAVVVLVAFAVVRNLPGVDGLRG